MLTHAAHARFVWNLALEQWDMWTRDKTMRGVHTPNNAVRMRQLTEARGASEWLRAGSTVVQQGALRDFDRAATGFFAGHKQRPTWRKAGHHEGFVIRDLTLTRLSRRWATVTVPKVGSIRFRVTRDWEAVTAATSARVTLRHGQWHIALTTPPAPPQTAGTGQSTGIDRGVANTLTLSDGTFHQAPTLTTGEQARFIHLQRRLARQHKGSNRRAATKAALGRLHLRLTNRRTDWVEQTTTTLARNYDHIALEKLNTRGMTKRPAPQPDPDTPGAFLPNQARAKAALNKAILASCWGQFADRLEHKTLPGHVIYVNPANTSRQCHQCGHTAPENRESQAVFRCHQCGHTTHADTNAARNIQARAFTPQPEDFGGSDRTVARPQPCQPPTVGAA